MFSVISGQTLTMFLMIVLGYGIFRAGLVDHAGNKAISDILLLVVTPCMILQNFSTSPYDPARVRSFLLAIALGFAAHFVMILISRIFLRGDSGKNADLGIERYLAVYSNCGFMGIPIVSAVFGGDALQDILGFFRDSNLRWGLEGARLYPMSRKAASVRNVLIARAEAAGVKGAFCRFGFGRLNDAPTTAVLDRFDDLLRFANPRTGA